MKVFFIASCIAALAASPVRAAAEEREPLEIFFSERLVSDDNLYRRPDGAIDVVDANGRTLHGEDYINRLSAGVDGRWPIARQLLRLVLQVDDNRYSRNDQLDHISGQGKLAWDWQAGSDFSGTLGADYERALVDFANSRLFTRDLVDRGTYSGEARYKLGSRWSVGASVRYGETSHSIETRKVDDFESKSGGFLLRYETPAGTMLGADYHYTDARFPQQALLNGLPFDRSYDESLTGLRLKYGLTTKLLLEATAGYLQRSYSTQQSEDFSGDVWRAALQWQPTIKTQITFSGWRQLQAYVDAESDYFVSTGGSIAPSWSPRRKLLLQMELSLEDQDYLTSALNPLFTQGRHDKVKSGLIRAIYTPQQPWRIDLTYRRTQRESNRQLLEYRDDLASLGLRFTF